jgi:uncharacterized repeat protein (TIGR03803 family)
MKKLRICAPLTFLAAPSRKGDSVGRLRLSQVACAVFVFCVASVISSPAQTFNLLANFDGTDGALAQLMSLVQGTDGNFYGTTTGGGANDSGTVFRITPEGTITVLHSFDGTDGSYPIGGLVQATNGDFYGTTSVGGANGYGTVFKITEDGKLTTLYSFCSLPGCLDGLTPAGTMVQAADKDLYGTTSAYYGTVFKISPEGKLMTLYSFCSEPKCVDGSYPIGGLVQATNGNFYGTTTGGGANDSGTVFRITPEGTITVLHSFDGTDGALPFSTLVQGQNGNLYGTTVEGGPQGEFGTVFKITPEGRLTTLHDFCLTNCADGIFPYAGLVRGTDGKFYGATYGGGSNPDCTDCGTVFSISREGKLTTLHSFDVTEGYHPVGGLLQATDGDFYGTTMFGGAYGPPDGDGSVFSVSVGLEPFVTTRPNSGKVGTDVTILGNNLTDAASVTFNETAATFNIVSGTEIKTSVPTGATTGPVEVTTLGGTLKSNVEFHVP